MKLLEEPTEVNDKPGAPDLMVHDGEIEFGMLLSFQSCHGPKLMHLTTFRLLFCE